MLRTLVDLSNCISKSSDTIKRRRESTKSLVTPISIQFKMLWIIANEFIKENENLLKIFEY